MGYDSGKLNVAIIGSGNIGTDLLYKTISSKHLQPMLFVGRNADSVGLRKARELGVETSADGIEFLEENSEHYDCVFDATSASAHKINNEVFRRKGKVVVDLTPAKIGPFCVPSINLDKCLNEQNINMITCGGQTSLPMAYALKNAAKSLDYIEVVSSISSKSAGIATRENMDEYLTTTEKSLSYFSGAKKTKAILNINPAKPCVYMQTTIYASGDFESFDVVEKSVKEMEAQVRNYVPGYKLALSPVLNNGRVTLSISVKGRGDYLPEYAGNLDIINCAAIAAAEYRFFSQQKKVHTI